MKDKKVVLGALSLLLFSITASASLQIPKVKIAQSVALDMICPAAVVDDKLTPVQLALISKLPSYDVELAKKVPWFQMQWDARGPHLMETATDVVGKPFPMQDLEAAVFLCPRFPFMGTPLAFNVVSYLDVTAKDLGLQKPNDIFYFVSTAFHEVLHKYITDILSKHPSAILAATKEDDLYEAHLHLFALQKRVFERAGLVSRLREIEFVEAGHGPAYARAWKAVHGDAKLEADLIAELQK
jgi:hypothetical protein